MSSLGPWPAWPLAGPPSDLAAVLWRDREPLRAAYDSSRAMLARLADAVRGTELAGAGEFAVVAARLLACDPETLRAVWSDPRGYWWTRTAHALLQEALEHPSAADARIAAHLAELKLFAVGAVSVGATDWVFDTPVTVGGGTRIPGTAWAIDDLRTVSVTAVIDGHLRAGDRIVPLRATPVARCAGYELFLDPGCLGVPGFEEAEPAVAAGESYQQDHLGLVEAALRNIARYAPEEFSRMSEVVRVAALKPPEAGGFDDFSNPELPGSFIVSAVPNPLELGEHLLHEVQHNCLSLVEESGALFIVDGDGSTIYYSPWRAKPRALYGLFHGVYVFVALWRYWRNAAADDALDDGARAYALDRVTRIPQQLRLGVGVLRRYARLTTLGTAILDELQRVVEAIAAEFETLDTPRDPPAFTLTPEGGYSPLCSAIDGAPLTARGAVREHVALHDTEDRTAWGDRVIVFVTQNTTPITMYLRTHGAPVAGLFRVRTYDDLFRSRHREPGPYCFADLEALTDDTRSRAAAVCDELTAGGTRVLNHPLRSLRRYDLLQMLRDRGTNQFGVFRAREQQRDSRFPVFLRDEHDHFGSRSPLLHTPAELETALARLRAGGRSTDDTLVVEFLDTADRNGTYRKYGAFVIGDRVLPRHLFVDERWELKGPERVDDESLAEEHEYLATNPHEAAIQEIASVAGIAYGRIDYSLLDGALQVWEFNTNPTLTGRLRPGRPPSAPRAAASLVRPVIRRLPWLRAGSRVLVRLDRTPVRRAAIHQAFAAELNETWRGLAGG